MQGEIFVVLHNRSTPHFVITGLEDSTNYTMQVCASNYEYWMEESCTTLTAFTASRYGESTNIVSCKALPLYM